MHEMLAREEEESSGKAGDDEDCQGADVTDRDRMKLLMLEDDDAARTLVD